MVGLAAGVGLNLQPDNSSEPTVVEAPTLAAATIPDEVESADDRKWASRSISEETVPSTKRVSFGFCHTGGGFNCVVDGDTIWLEGTKVRIADIDAPETHDPRCPEERTLGDRATRRLQQLLSSGTVTLQGIDRDEDTYGRKLRLVYVDGQSVGDTLIGEGLVRAYGNGRQPWC